MKLLRGTFLGATTVGERGQVVIPAEARKAYDIKMGDKLMVFSRPRQAGLLLVRADFVSRLVSDRLTEVSQLEQLLDQLQSAEPEDEQEVEEPI
ncbi:MAG: AbrB/MazE/SpoVT family DNA-binding domain-containing protein [Bacillota bacterium]